jgi:hypothetical protein
LQHSAGQDDHLTAFLAPNLVKAAVEDFLPRVVVSSGCAIHRQSGVGNEREGKSGHRHHSPTGPALRGFAKMLKVHCAAVQPTDY